MRLALLFGSRARGTARPDSDVDLAVGKAVDGLGLAADLREALGLEVDVVRLEQASIPLLRELVDDARVVHEAAPGAAAAWRTAALLALEVDGPWYRRLQDAWLARVAARGLSRGQGCARREQARRARAACEPRETQESEQTTSRVPKRPISE